MIGLLPVLPLSGGEDAPRLRLVPAARGEMLLDLHASSDGSRLLTTSYRKGSRSYAPRLWDARKNLVLAILPGHSGEIVDSGFSPDGKTAFTMSASLVLLWDAVRGREIGRFAARPSERIVDGEFATDGTLGFGTSAGRIFTLKGAESKEIATVVGSVRAIATAPDGSRFAAATPAGLTLIGRDGTKKVVDLKSVWELHFAPDSASLLASSFGTLDWSGDKVDGYATLLGTDGTVRLTRPHAVAGRGPGTVQGGADFTAAGPLFWNPDGTGVLLDPASLKPAHVLKGNAAAIREIRFSPDRRRATTCDDEANLWVWDLSSGKGVEVSGAPETPTAATFTHDGTRILLGDTTGRLQSIDPAKGEAVDLPFLSTLTADEVRLLADGRFQVWQATGESNLRGDIRTSEVRDARSLATAWRMGQGLAQDASFDGRYAFVTSPTYSWAGFRNLADPKKYEDKLTDYKNIPQHVAFSSGSARAFVHGATEGDGTASATLVNLDTCEPIAGWTIKQKESLGQGALAPDGRTVVSGWFVVKEEPHIVLWDAEEGKILHDLGPNQGYFTGFAFSASGDRLAVNANGVVRVFDVKSGAVVATTAKLDDGFDGNGVRWAGENRVAVVTSRNLGVWDAASGAAVLVRENKGVSAVSPDGRLAAVAEGKAITLLDMASGKAIGQANAEDEIGQFAFLPGGRRLLSVDPTGGIVAWDTSGTGDPVRLGSLQIDSLGNFLAMDEAGRYDATDPSDVPAAHYVYAWSGGLEAVEVGQLKSRFYEPGLWAKLLELDPAPLRSVPKLDAVRIYPTVKVAIDGKNRAVVEVGDRDGGGIGDVTVAINGKVVDTRPGAGYFKVDLEKYRSYLLPGEMAGPEGNRVEVRASNAGGDLVSPPAAAIIPLPADLKVPDARIHALFVGAGDYVGSGGDLVAPAADASALEAAVRRAGERLLPGRVATTTMTTAPGGTRPTRDAIKAWMDKTAKEAGPKDAILVTVSGHGTSEIGGKEDYFFLTPDADPTAVNAGVIGTSSVSGKELREWLAAIPAAKQVLVLDTCHSGAAAKSLDLSSRSVAGQYGRAYEAIRDGAGTWLLAGSAADQLSYEAANVEHGLLTYALLEAIDRGTTADGLRAGENGEGFLDVERWLRYAADRVESLKAEAGVPGVQRPEFRRSAQGRTFDLGVVAKEDVGKVGLKSPLPVVIVGTFSQDEEDPAKLEPEVEKAFRGATGFKAWFDVAKHPGAYRVAGTYAADGAGVKVKAVLQRFDSAGSRSTIATFDLAGSVAEVAVKLRTETEKRLTAKRPSEN